MRILITGAEGFIGKHLVSHLRKYGHNVLGIDKRDGDLTSEGVADEMVGMFKPDVVVHLAAQVGIFFNEQDLVHAVNSNVIMTMRVAKACVAYGAKMVHTSTSEVYGDAGLNELDETSPLIHKPTGIYAISKRWSEDVVREYALPDYVIIRPSMPYGPGAPPGQGRRAMDNMLWQAHHNKPIIVHSGARRSWCHIYDIVEGYRLIIENNATGIFNVGRDDNEISMLNIAQEACRIAGASESLIEVVEPPAKKTMVKRLSTRRLRELGWQPTIELEVGMLEVYNWIKDFEWSS